MEKIRYLSIDLETYSSVSLPDCGVYKYAEAPDADVLLFGYSVNGGPVNVVDVASGEDVPEEILAALSDNSVLKWAFNASFERIFLSVWLGRHHPEHFSSYSISEDTVGRYLDPAAWRCSMVWCAYMGLPLSLEKAGAVLGLPDQKMAEGKALIRYFCAPCSPTKANGGRTRNLPSDAPDKWSVFKAYNLRDVEVEMAIQERLSKFPVPDAVWEEYALDQEINDRGIAVDMEMAENAIKFDELSRASLTEAMRELTGLDNPNSVMQMKQWLTEHGVDAESLDKKAVARLMADAPPEVAKILRLRQKLAKSSVKKYQKMRDAACSDMRARGMFQFYGAGRTGRWAGRLIQLQNLPQNHMPDLAEARSIVKSGDYELMGLLYDDIPDALSQLIRTAFVPKEGYKFVVADFSSIEARVLSFLAGEQWRLDVFEGGGDIYCASASQMFKVPVEKHGQNSHLRQKGKIAELALGYGGSVGALKAMGALEMGLSEDELPSLVSAWRDSNPHIVSFWWDIDRAATEAVRTRGRTEAHGLTFTCRSGMLFIALPSGRSLSYVKPRLSENQFGGECITYEGTTAGKHWSRIETYGPKLVENIIQAISRDILAYAMRTLSHCFICGHVHDELIIECSRGVSVDAICEQMGRTPPWIAGLPLRADGYECEFYQKD
ncbi:MAG: DNA polymerase [Clostridiales bacterium]|nr:DNA polymerase [Clostridiales bacterium]